MANDLYEKDNHIKKLIEDSNKIIKEKLIEEGKFKDRLMNQIEKNNKLKKDNDYFYKYKKVDVVKGYVKFIFTNKKLEKLYKKNYLYNQNKTFTIINKNPVNLGALSFRKKIFYKQKFNNKLKYGEDTDLSIKLTMLNYKFYNNKKVSLFYRIHGNNMTLNRKYPVNLKNHFHSQRIEDRKAILKSIFTNFRKKIN
jgi:hypothetical protein